jgi:hypothetical protein
MITNMIEAAFSGDPMAVITGIAVLALVYWLVAMFKGLLS